jgi:protein TonB
MFDQALLPDGQRGWALPASFAIQTVSIAGILLATVWLTEALPVRRWVPLVEAPRLTPPPATEIAATRAARALRPFSPSALTSPFRIPDRVALIEEMSTDALPNMAGLGDAAAHAIRGSLLGDLLGQAKIPDTKPVTETPKAAPPPAEAPARLKVSSGVQEAQLLRRVVPAYPPLAKQARIQGTVQFTAVIATNGSIESLELVSGHPLLVRAAYDAVRQWRYRPTYLNGQPVEVFTQIAVRFNLSQ